MTACILFFCVYGYHLLVPGYLIARLLGLRRGRFLLAFALSYALLLLNLIPMEWLKTPLWIFTLAFNLQVGFLLVANVVVGWRARDDAVGRRPTWPSLTQCCWPPLAIVAGVLIYLAWAGPYMELPADAWHHVERFLYAQQSILSGHFDRLWIWGDVAWPEYISHQGWHWYMLHALLCKMSGITMADSWLPLAMANTMVFCLAIYWFAMFLWSRHHIHRIQKIQAALWTTCFAAIGLGVSVFAYIRYYAFAPTILNYVMYLAVIVLACDYLRSPSWWSKAVWLAPILLAAMNVIHAQEAVFAFFMGFGMLLVMEGQWVWSRIGRGRAERRVPAQVVNILKIHILFVGGLIVFGLLLFHALQKPMAGYAHAVLMPVFNSELLHWTWFVQPPAGQFFQVVTWWGVFVYILFCLYIRQFRRQPFILAGMLMPCLVVFNPLTIVILARWIPDVNTVYRFNYMIPLPFVAGFMAMRFWGEMKLWIGAGWRISMRSGQKDWPAQDAKKPKNIINAQDAAIANTQQRLFSLSILSNKISFFSVLLRVSRAIIVQIKSMLFYRGTWSAVALSGLMVLLLPFEPLFGMKTNSRFYSLRPVPEGNDPRRWGDLIALAQAHPQAVILSDTYTSIILHWLGVATSGDWWSRPSLPTVDRLSLLRDLDCRRDWWVVVNRRNGEFSANGYMSGHWSGDVLMHFPSFYPENLILFIKQHPELFKEIWSKNQIQVYDIDETRLWKSGGAGKGD